MKSVLSKAFQKTLIIRYMAMVMIFLCASLFSFYAQTSTPSLVDYRKDNVPWPWGKEIEFPWREAQGTYSVDLNGEKIYISLRILRTNAAPDARSHEQMMTLFVNIRLVNSETCQLIGIGRGFKKGNLIRAQFVNQLNNEVYVMSLHTFNEEVAKMSGVYTNRKDMVMVASVGLLRETPSADPRQMMTSPMIRVANVSDSCEMIQKKATKNH